MTIQERFWSKVNKLGPYPKKYTKVKTRCYEWTGAITTAGYGQFAVEKGHVVGVHRFAYELKHGKGSLGKKQACHKCDNKKCIRWSHLFKGTHPDNSDDKVAKGRQSHVKGEAHGRSKLTVKQVSKIRNLYATGKYYYRELGIIFGVASTTIGKIINNSRWI